MKIQKILRYFSAILLTAFGLLTLFLSSAINFDLFDIRAKEGNYVLFVVQANFISSLFYLFAAYGFLKIKSWTRLLLAIASVILIISFVFLKVHISQGGIYEVKTVGAMIFRISLTAVFTLIAHFTIQKGKKESVN